MMDNVSNNNIAFVLCSPRSGSTLLMRILNAHSKIASPFEIGLPYLFKRDVKENIVLEKTALICGHLGIDYAKACEEPRYLMNSVLEKEEKELLVVKDPRHAIFAREIHEQFGDVPIIHLTRDVRFVSHSNMFKDKYLLGMNRWYEYNSAILANKNLFSRYLRIKYEDLTSSTVQTVKQVLEFLGYQYEFGMENYWNFKHTDDALALWEGGAPQDSELQNQLYSNQIFKANDRPVPDMVLELYRQRDYVRRMNELLGYAD